MLVIRVDNCRSNLIGLYDVLKILGYSSDTDLLQNLLDSYKSSDINVLQLSDDFIGDTNEVRYVKCINDDSGRHYRVYRGYADFGDTVKADVESVFIALRVRASREDYKSILMELLGSTDVPIEAEQYMRNPRVPVSYYDNDFSIRCLYDFEADEINKRSKNGVVLKRLTAEIYEDHCKKMDKRMNGTAGVQS